MNTLIIAILNFSVIFMIAITSADDSTEKPIFSFDKLAQYTSLVTIIHSYCLKFINNHNSFIQINFLISILYGKLISNNF